MSKIGIFYGSTTGSTQHVAGLVAEALQVPSEQVHSVDKLDSALVDEYDTLVLGTSTWGSGELQDDWYDALDILKAMDLSKHKVALFGCGDSMSYSDTFCAAMGEIYENLLATGATFVGKCSIEGYTFDESPAVVDNQFVGLAIDEDNEGDMTEARIKAWISSVV